MYGHLIFAIKQAGLWGIFSSMVVENIGIPFPTEGAFWVAQRYILQGLYSFWEMYFFIVGAQLFGATLAYALGRFFGVPIYDWLERFRHFGRAKERIHSWYDKYGSVTVLATRLVGYVRPWSSLVAGFAEFPFWPFLLWTTVGTLIFTYPTLRVTAFLILIWQRFPRFQLLFGLALFIAFFGAAIYAFFGRFLKKNRPN